MLKTRPGGLQLWFAGRSRVWSRGGQLPGREPLSTTNGRHPTKNHSHARNADVPEGSSPLQPSPQDCPASAPRCAATRSAAQLCCGACNKAAGCPGACRSHPPATGYLCGLVFAPARLHHARLATRVATTSPGNAQEQHSAQSFRIQKSQCNSDALTLLSPMLKSAHPTLSSS